MSLYPDITHFDLLSYSFVQTICGSKCNGDSYCLILLGKTTYQTTQRYNWQEENMKVYSYQNLRYDIYVALNIGYLVRQFV
jgi:hypothetical protein